MSWMACSLVGAHDSSSIALILCVCVREREENVISMFNTQQNLSRKKLRTRKKREFGPYCTICKSKHFS